MRVRAPVPLLALVLTSLLAGCGSSKSPSSTRADAPTSPTTSAATTGTTPTTATTWSAATAKAKRSAQAAKRAKRAAADHAKTKHKSRHAESASASSDGAESSSSGSSSSSSGSSASAPSTSPSSPATPAPAPKPKRHTTRRRPPAAKPKKPSPPTGPLVATLHASGHSPKVGHWPISVDLAKGGTPVPGHISYEFLFNGSVVSRQKVAQPPIPPGGAHSPDFTGHFHDVLTWPDRAVGIPLTLRVIVTSKYGTKNLDWAVKVHR